VTAAASNVFGKQADVSIASADESFTGIRHHPQLKRTRRFMPASAAMPISSADAKECHPEDRCRLSSFSELFKKHPRGATW